MKTKNVKILVSVLRNHEVKSKDSTNITYGILNQILKVLDDMDVPIKQLIPCLATLSNKK